MLPSKPRTLSIGGATYDLFLKLDETAEEQAIKGKELQFAIGGKVQIASVKERCGGGASNTSVGLSRLGCQASFCGILGEDQWGEAMLQNLRREHVHTDFATIVEGETSSFSAIVSLRSGERTILFASGVSEHLHDTTFAREAILHVDAVYLNHLCDTSCMIEDDIIKMLSLNPKAYLSWNPGGCQISAGMRQRDKAALLKRTTFLLLNREEALTFTHAKSIRDALKTLSQAGAKNICITDGSKGTYATDGAHCYFCPAMKNVQIIDSTGAGDAFGTGATWAILNGKSLPTALVAGTLNASSVLGEVGAEPGLLTLEEMDRRLKTHPLTVELLSW